MVIRESVPGLDVGAPTDTPGPTLNGWREERGVLAHASGDGKPLLAGGICRRRPSAENPAKSQLEDSGLTKRPDPCEPGSSPTLGWYMKVDVRDDLRKKWSR